jgi:hypothetical protein
MLGLGMTGVIHSFRRTRVKDYNDWWESFLELLRIENEYLGNLLFGRNEFTTAISSSLKIEMDDYS